MRICDPRHLIGITGARIKGRYVARTLLAFVLAVTLVAHGSVGLAAPKPSDRAAGRTSKELGLRLDAMPDVKMASGVLLAADGTVLWERTPDQQRAMASITKIMTAVVALERCGLDEQVTVPKISQSVGESTSDLRTGRTLPLSELLEALLVKSGNDAAVTVAEHVGGSEEAFVGMMNAKAAELGLSKTHYVNPHGLDQKGQYSTALDLGILARYAMTKPEFRRIVALKTADIQTSDRTYEVHNTNILIDNYDGANGVKTGWTDKAGYCVIDSAKRGDVELYAVVLGTGSELQRFKDARELLDWGFAHYRPRQLVSAGTVVAKASVVDFLDVAVGAQVAEDYSANVFDLDGSITRTVRVARLKAPVTKGERVGVATFAQGDKVVATVPLVAAQDIDAPNIFERLGIGVVRIWRKMFGGQLVAPPVTSSAVS